MKRRRVKITGIGPVTPAGIGKDEFWRGMLEGKSYIRPFDKFGAEFGPLIAACVDRFVVAKYVNRERLPKGIGRHTQFAAAGAMLALQDAGIDPQSLSAERCVVVTGSSLMDFGGISNSTHAVHTRGPGAALPRTIFTTTNANVTETINAVLGVSCRTMTLQNSCCSGMDAVGFAAAMIARGEAEMAICGGTEAPLHQCPLLELRAAGLTPPTTEMSDRFARPYDLWRTTGVVSEGACMFVLEAEQSSRRGYGFVSGFAFANDRPGVICSGLAEAARLALADAGMRVDDLEALNGWGPGHRVIDAGEGTAMRTVFGSSLARIPAYSIKGALGSALGAAPAIQIAVATLAQDMGVVPPTVNWQRRDPECPLCLSHNATYVEHQTTLVNAHGVGNVNSCMILSRC